MQREEFNIIWESIEEERQQDIISRVNVLAQTQIEKQAFVPNIVYNFCLNLVFDKEEPVEYIYLEGTLIGIPVQTNVGGLVNLQLKLNYIEKGNEVDDFLDRRSEIEQHVVDMKNKEELNPYKIETQLDAEAILNISESLQTEMNEMIDAIKKTDRGAKLEYNDLQTVFFLNKIAQIQIQINNSRI